TVTARKEVASSLLVNLSVAAITVSVNLITAGLTGVGISTSYSMVKLKIRWIRLAWDDLRKIDTFISNDSPAAAQKVLTSIWESTQILKEHPHPGRPGRVPTGLSPTKFRFFE
ncbi:MAG: type II toxin-antitoxin system RelE/ParE family toxin, partial [Desulfobacterales bacterium]